MAADTDTVQSAQTPYGTPPAMPGREAPNGSKCEGTINIVENAAGGDAAENNSAVIIEKGSTWTLTDDCAITSLENNGTINFNGHTITLANGEVLST